MAEETITKQQIDRVLGKYGFTCLGFASDPSMYLYTKLGLGISVRVYPKTNEFEICHTLDHSVMFLSSPVCGPFYEETPKHEQFKKIFTQFMKAYNKLI